MDKDYGFVYIWYDRKHKRYYVGCHWGNENDGYVCSSQWMMQAFYRRKDDFKRKVIIRVDDREQLLEEEFKWLSLIKDEELGKRYYNLSKKHFGHWTTTESRRKTVGEKISNSHKENPDWGKWNIGLERSEETKEKLRQANFGKTMSQESSKKKSEAMKKVWENGDFKISSTTYDKNRNKSEETRKKISENNKRLQAEGKIGTKGKKYSDESKARMSEAQKECKAGVRWWTNTITFEIKQTKECPGINWITGRMLNIRKESYNF